MNAPVLSTYLDLLEAGAPISIDGVSFYPLTPREPCPDTLVCLLEDTSEGLEVRETNVVSELEVVNGTDLHVLLLEGDVVAGGRQNRVINSTFVVEPHATVRMPTSCVEQGRWGVSKGAFSGSGTTVSPRMRSKLKRSVTSSAIGSGGKSYLSNQGEVWEEASNTLTQTGSASPTQDLLAAYAKKAEELDAKTKGLVESLTRPDLVGVAITHPDGTAAVEAFGSPRIAAKVLERIVRAHLLAPGGVNSPREVSALLDDVRQAEPTAVPAAGGVGQQVRLERASMSASAYLFGESALHVSADWEVAAGA